MKTFAGWTVVGSQPGPHKSADLRCHRVVVKEVVPSKPFHQHFILESKGKEIVTPQALNKMLEIEFIERSCEQEHGHFIQDKAFLRKMAEECTFKNGHYELPLPFVKEEQVRMPNNRSMAIQRMESLKRKLLRNPSFHADYLKFMNDLLSKDYASRVPEPTKSKDGKYGVYPIMGLSSQKTK